MTKALFDAARDDFLTGDLDWPADASLSVSLVRGYTFNAAHDTVSDITGAGGTIHATETLAGKTASGAGVADATDVVFTTPAASAINHGLLLHQETGNPSTDKVIGYIDEGTGLPVQPDGTDITVQWSGGADKIFKL